jgi:hypothetical protein
MLNPARRSGEHDNEATRKALERADIDVRDGNPAFDLTHEKFDGRGRRGGVRQVAQLGDDKPDGDA